MACTKLYILETLFLLPDRPRAALSTTIPLAQIQLASREEFIMRLSILLAVCAQLFHAGASNFNLKNSLAAHSEQPQNVVESRDQPSVSPPTIFIRFGNKPIQVGYHARPTPGRDMLDVSLKNKLSDMCKNKKPGFDSCGKAVGRIKNIEHATLGQYGEGGFLVLHVLASYFPAGTAGEALRTTIVSTPSAVLKQCLQVLILYNDRLKQ